MSQPTRYMGGLRRRGFPIVLAAVAAALLFLPASAGAGPAGSSPDHIGVSASTTGLHIQHVVVIVLENEVIGNVWGHAPYENYLAHHYGNASSFYAACHPSAPNYLAMVSADSLQCNSDGWNNYKMTNIGDLLAASGYSYAAYAENLPKNACSQPGSATHGLFAVKHVPLLYFNNVTKSSTFCVQHVLPSSSFNSSVAAGTLGNYSFYTPNLCDDGHNGCKGNTTGAQMTKQADSWLKDFLGPMLNHTGRYTGAAEQHMIAHTAFLVVWDEGLGSNLGYAVSGVTSGNTYSYCASHSAKGDAACGGHVFAVVVSPYSLQKTFSTKDSDFGLVSTVEWLFHLGHMTNPGRLDSQSGFPTMSPLFSFTSN